MGTLYYGDSGTPVEIEDRALAHLKIAITTKLRRGELHALVASVAASPRPQLAVAAPRDPAALRLRRGRGPELSREWIEELMRSANSGGGIVIDRRELQALGAHGPEAVEAA